MHDQSECLVKLIKKVESAKYTIKEAVQAIQELDFGEDTYNINQYIKKRMQNNDISETINMERQDISLVVDHMLQNSQPTSTFVERSFFVLKKLLAKDRNFKVKNDRHYMILHFNASTWWLLACRVNYVPRLDLFCDSIALCISFIEKLYVFSFVKYLV